MTLNVYNPPFLPYFELLWSILFEKRTRLSPGVKYISSPLWKKFEKSLLKKKEEKVARLEFIKSRSPVFVVLLSSTLSSFSFQINRWKFTETGRSIDYTLGSRIN